MIYACCTENRKSAVQASVGAVLAVPVVVAPGSGYKVGDVLTLAAPGSSSNATVEVTTINATGGVTALQLEAGGTGYSTATGVPTTGGSGTGCTVSITSTPNGIDFLEVLSPNAIAPGVPAQPLLLVYCLRTLPAALTVRNILIEGGESITGIMAQWVALASAPPTSLPAALVSYLTPLGNTVLVIATNVIGDLSPYTLSLVNDLSTGAVLNGFDPQLAQVEFSFRVDCGPSFDCEPQASSCSPAPATAPAINYLAKDYGTFRTVMLDRLNQLLPDKMGSDETDPGVALVEMVAYLGDLLSYRQDAIATEAYLETAQSRVSLRRHALLVDYHVHDGCNARVWMHLDVTGNTGTAIPIDHTVTRFYTAAPGMPTSLAPGSGNERAAILAGVQAFEPMYDVQVYPEHNLLNFYTWGEANCCLPKGATSATLSGSYPNLKVGDVLLFVEQVGPDTGDSADADLRHRCAVRLTSVATQDANGQPLVDPLFASDGTALSSATQTPAKITQIAWSAEDALPFPLCLSSTYTEDGDSHSVPNVSAALGNIVLADHGLTLTGVPLPTVPPQTINAPVAAMADRCNPTTAASRPVRFRPTVPDSPLTQSVALTLNGTPATPDPSLSASALISMNAGDALPSITLGSVYEGVPSTGWTPQQDLLESGESDLAFVVEVEGNGTATLRFGDNTNGRAPDSGTAFTATYRIGNGTAGNVGAESINLKAAHPSVSKCWNPMAAGGGTDPETSDQIRRRAPQAFLTQDRAVTLADYEAQTETNTGVDQAVASMRWTGSWYTVFVAVEPQGGGNLSPTLRSSLQNNLERYRLMGQDLELDSPDFVSLDIVLKVTVDPAYFRANVEQALLAVLGNKLLPNGQKGLFYPDNFTFGETVYLGPVYAAARSVAGVTSVVATRFQIEGGPAAQYLANGAIPLGSLQVARLENDPSYPDHGTLTLVMEGGK